MRTPRRGPALMAVSCVSQRWCMAVGESETRTLAERWDGRSWSVERMPRSQSQAWAVSCSSPRVCMAVANGRIERWNGVRWSLQHVPRPRHTFDMPVWAVSCFSATGCMAVGDRIASNATNTQSLLVLGWNGDAWSRLPTPAIPRSAVLPQLDGLSCVSRHACVAVGRQNDGFGGGIVARWNGHSWITSPSKLFASDDALGSASCVSAINCTAVNQFGPNSAYHWNGSTWSREALPGHSNRTVGTYFEPQGISCATRGFCVAAGDVDLSPAQDIMYGRPRARRIMSGTRYPIVAIRT